MVFVPLTDFFSRFGDVFIDDDCKAQCFSEESWGVSASAIGSRDQVGTAGYLEEDGGSDFCTKTITERFSCADSNIRKKLDCFEACANDYSYCTLPKIKKSSCQSLILEEEAWARKGIVQNINQKYKQGSTLRLKKFVPAIKLFFKSKNGMPFKTENTIFVSNGCLDTVYNC